MNPAHLLRKMETDSCHLVRAELLVIRKTGSVLVAIAEEHRAELECDLLCTSDDSPVRLQPGDCVLVLLPTRESGRGVVLGRIGGRVSTQRSQTPEELIIEGKKKVIIRCGDGSIAIQSDGRILIKGTDLVSHARRL